MRKILVIFLFIVLSVLPMGRAEGEHLNIYFLDVGQADSTIITCNDDVLMIDGGNVADSRLIYSVLRNTLGIEHINYMIATHPHEDHVGGLAAALNACSVDVLLTPVLEYDTKAFRSMMKYAVEQDTEIEIPSVGDTFMIGSAQVEILGPTRYYENTNDMSIVCKITYGETTFLFGGDAEWDAERPWGLAGSGTIWCRSFSCFAGKRHVHGITPWKTGAINSGVWGRAPAVTRQCWGSSSFPDRALRMRFGPGNAQP